MEFSRQEYLTGSPFPSPGELPNPGIEPTSPAQQADSVPTELPGKPIYAIKGICFWVVKFNAYMCFLNQVTSVQTHMCRDDIKSIYLNPQKSNTTKQDGISDQERLDGRGSVSVRRIMLLRNQESHLHVVDLDSMETRTCLVSGTLSVGE